MKRFVVVLSLGWGLLAAGGCGKKGPLEFPFSRTPETAGNVAVRQRGDRAVLEWSNPRNNIDGRPLAGIDEVEIWVLAGDAGGDEEPLDPADVERRARLAARIRKEDFGRYFTGESEGGPRMSYPYPLETDRAAGRRWTFSLRVRAGGGRFSEFTPPVSLGLRTCARPPEGLEIRLFEERIEVLWTPPRANIDGTAPPEIAGYVVFRADDGGRPRPLTPEPIPDTGYVDRDFRFGGVYGYFVRARSSNDEPVLESWDSEGREIEARDTFPPQPPEGLEGIAGEHSISLSWKAAAVPDLAGYRVWRREEGAPGETLLTAALIPDNYFRDPSVRAGTPYLYTVSALDRSGNESPRSQPTAVVVKEGEA